MALYASRVADSNAAGSREDAFSIRMVRSVKAGEATMRTLFELAPISFPPPRASNALTHRGTPMSEGSDIGGVSVFVPEFVETVNMFAAPVYPAAWKNSIGQRLI